MGSSVSDPAVGIADLLADLHAESAELDALVSSLSADEWRLATPAEGWDVARQIEHLTFVDELAVLAATDPDAFAVAVRTAGKPSTDVERVAARRAAQPPVDLLRAWRRGRGKVAAALAAAPSSTRLPWGGPPMSPTSMATARLMETWAHGVDIADALGVDRPASLRIRHIAHLGVRTRDFAYVNRGRTPPREPFRVELIDPTGHVWASGAQDAPESVRGPMHDFCLLVTQRRHRSELAVTAAGEHANEWLDIAQAFAGPPGSGRLPRGVPR